MNFTSVRGHLYNYDFPTSCKLWNINKITKLYEEDPIPLIKPEDIPIKKNLQSLAKKADILILWLDCDREGENIAFEVMDVVKKCNSKIKILRAHFSALTEKDIKYSIENLQQPNKNLSDAVEIRQKMDLLMGASFTRLQTLCFRKIFEKYIDSNEIKRFSKPSYEYNNIKSKMNSNSENIQVPQNKIIQNKVKNDFNYNMIISYGPCQFPTLNFIVERDEEIKNFISKNFYSLIFKLNKKLNETEIILFRENRKTKNSIYYNNDYSSNDINTIDISNLSNSNENSKIIKDTMIVEFQWTNERLEKKSTAEEICNRLQRLYRLDKNSLKVIESKKKPKVKNRPLPLNTVEMQKLISRKLKIQSYKAMSIAEKLYNMGYISYPRTETQIYSQNENLKKIVEDLCINNYNDINENAEYSWIEYGKKLLRSGKKLIAREGKLNDNSHPPISPVKYAKKSDLTIEEYKIYNLLVLHFLASVSDDASGEETEVKIEIDKEVFTAKGFNMIKKGYLNIYPYEEWNEKFIPHFEKGEAIIYNENSKFEVHEGKTKPPPQMTEAELIELMDKNGIGTDATIHEHIKTVKERNYIVQTGSVLRPTIFGLGLIKSYQALNIEIYKPNLRAAMEKDLSRICKGELSSENLFYKMREESLKLFKAVQNNITSLEENLENYLSNAIKKDDYIKLNEISEPGININDYMNETKQNNEIFKTTKKKEYENGSKHQSDYGSPDSIEINFGDSSINQNDYNSNIRFNEKVNFSKEYEESLKSKAENEEIIKSIVGSKNNKSETEKNKKIFENRLRGVLKMEKKRIGTDSEESSDEIIDSSDNNSANKSSFNNNKDENIKRDILELNFKCPSCQSAQLKILKNKRTLCYFIGCSAFPQCTFTKSINNPHKIRISNEFCQKCIENNQKNLLFELEFNNLKDNSEITKEECLICIMDSDSKISNKNSINTNGYNNYNAKKYEFKKKNNFNKYTYSSKKITNNSEDGKE